jgi:tRNA (adenine57-N1/adenine58-N1)-methyltransferase
MRRAGITDPSRVVMLDTSTEPDVVREGDLVLIALDRRRRYIVEAGEGRILHTDRGPIHMDEVLGKPYGSRIAVRRGEALILRPLLEDILMLGYRRKSQVIYPKDLGYMVLLGNVRPGSRVAEAGVGTGFLTTVLAHFVGRDGVVYGFDIRSDMIETARRNLEMAGLLGRVRLVEHDVREGLPIDSPVDAVFLDLPDPWNVVQPSYRALRPCGRLVVFQPTINQVERTAIALRSHGGFADIGAVELLLREYIVEEGRVRPHTRMIGHTGYILYARKILRESEKK